MSAQNHAIGIDVGGTGIKGALVDLDSGELVSDRIKLATPEGGKPDDIVETTKEIVEKLAAEDPDAPVGVCFPAIVSHGVTLSAANVSKKWIGLHAEELFEKALGRDIHFVNDADAAGYAETRFGAAKGVAGTVFMATLGTGIGSALIVDGVLVPNTELGHLEVNGRDAETRVSATARERRRLRWKTWANEFNEYLARVETYLWPDLIILGGGISKVMDKYGPLLKSRAPIVPAQYRNTSGIIGAALNAADHMRLDALRGFALEVAAAEAPEPLERAVVETTPPEVNAAEPTAGEPPLAAEAATTA